MGGQGEAGCPPKGAGEAVEKSYGSLGGILTGNRYHTIATGYVQISIDYSQINSLGISNPKQGLSSALISSTAFAAHSDSCLGLSRRDAGSWGRGLRGLHPDLSSPDLVEERSFWKSSMALRPSPGVSPAYMGMGIRTGGQVPGAGLIPCHRAGASFRRAQG